MARVDVWWDDDDRHRWDGRPLLGLFPMLVSVMGAIILGIVALAAMIGWARRAWKRRKRGRGIAL